MLQVHGSKKRNEGHPTPGAASHPSAGRLLLVPYPVRVEQHGVARPFHLSQDTQVLFGDDVPAADLSVRTLRDLVAKAEGPSSGGGSIKLELVPHGDHPEGYFLGINDSHVVLQAQTPAGLFYGVQTLKQLVPREGPPVLPAVRIWDHPRFDWRGVHLDVSRHFFTAAQVKTLLDNMAAYKLNRFHWHLTDDQGWRLPVPVLPELTRRGAEDPDGAEEAYTEDEIRDVVAYAKERHIEVMPEVDVPGHAAAAIAAYPELGNTDIYRWEPPKHPIYETGEQEYTLAPSTKVVNFLRKVLRQLADLFPSQYIHIGGDEAPKTQWDRSMKARSVSMVSHQQVQSFFNKQLAQMLHKLNRTFVGWDEVQHIGGLPSDAVITAWRSAKEVRTAVMQGRRVVNADMERFYFDHYQGPKRFEPEAICCMTTLREVYEYDPMPYGLTKEQQKLVLGPQAQLWSEYFPTWHQVEYMAFPRSLALAERAWTPSEQLAGFRDFRTRLLARLPDLKKRGTVYRDLKGEDLM